MPATPQEIGLSLLADVIRNAASDGLDGDKLEDVATNAAKAFLAGSAVLSPACPPAVSPSAMGGNKGCLSCPSCKRFDWLAGDVFQCVSPAICSKAVVLPVGVALVPAPESSCQAQHPSAA